MASPVRTISSVFNAFRWLFMPLGLLALIAIGVHAAADVIDDHLLRVIEQLDAWADGLLARSEVTADWVNRIDSRERTWIARGLALIWELAVDVFIAVPALGYAEVSQTERGFSVQRETWRALLSRLNQRPTPMRLLRPVLTGIFVIGGAYTVLRLVEATLFVGLVGDVAPADVSSMIARGAGIVALTLVLGSHGWRAVLRSLQHADARCEAATSLRERLFAGTWGTALAMPLAVALVLQARALLSVVL
jgi:hypothetical protein